MNCAAFSQPTDTVAADSHQQLEHFVIRLVLSLALASFAFASVGHAQAPDPQNTLVIETARPATCSSSCGPTWRPSTWQRVKQPRQGGLLQRPQLPPRDRQASWRRPAIRTGTGTGGSKPPDLPAEFTKRGLQARQRRRGAHATIPTAPTASSSSATATAAVSSTGQYTLWGEVIEGMENVDKIARGEPPAQPDKMLKVYLLA